MMVTGRHGVRMQYDYTQDLAGRPGAVSAASPRWLRLTRAGVAWQATGCGRGAYEHALRYATERRQFGKA